MCCILHVHFSDRKSLSSGPVDLQRKASIPLAARLPEMSSNMLGPSDYEALPWSHAISYLNVFLQRF